MSPNHLVKKIKEIQEQEPYLDLRDVLKKAFQHETTDLTEDMKLNLNPAEVRLLLDVLREVDLDDEYFSTVASTIAKKINNQSTGRFEEIEEEAINLEGVAERSKLRKIAFSFHDIYSDIVADTNEGREKFSNDIDELVEDITFEKLVNFIHDTFIEDLEEEQFEDIFSDEFENKLDQIISNHDINGFLDILYDSLVQIGSEGSEEWSKSVKEELNSYQVKGKGRGWFGESERHSKARKTGKADFTEGQRLDFCLYDMAMTLDVSRGPGRPKLRGLKAGTPSAMISGAKRTKVGKTIGQEAFKVGGVESITVPFELMNTETGEIFKGNVVENLEKNIKQLTPVSSSNVRGVGQFNNELLVQFHPKGLTPLRTYGYQFATPEMAEEAYRALTTTGSPGRWIWQNIRGHTKGEPVTPNKLGPAILSGRSTIGGTTASLEEYSIRNRVPTSRVQGFEGAIKKLKRSTSNPVTNPQTGQAIESLLNVRKGIRELGMPRTSIVSQLPKLDFTMTYMGTLVQDTDEDDNNDINEEYLEYNLPEKLYHVTSMKRAKKILDSKTNIKELYFYKKPYWQYAQKACEEDGDEPACIELDLSNYDPDLGLPFDIEYINEYHEEWRGLDIPPEFLEFNKEETGEIQEEAEEEGFQKQENQGQGRGWYGESERHSKAKKTGHADLIPLNSFKRLTHDFQEDFVVLHGPIARSGSYPYEKNGQWITLYKDYENLKSVYPKYDYLPLKVAEENGAHYAKEFGFAYNFTPNPETEEIEADLVILDETQFNEIKDKDYHVSPGYHDYIEGNKQYVLDVDHVSLSLGDEMARACLGQNEKGRSCTTVRPKIHDQNLSQEVVIK